MPLVIENLRKSFGAKPVLTGVSFTLEDNGVYCLMGPSGMGKTTLLRILLGRETADSGRVSGVAPEEISAMFQEDRLVPTLSAVENVALVCRGKAQPKALAAELARILPENCLHQPIAQLSGGMKRRVALARAMHYPGRMILLDEPFTGLDQATRMEVIAYLLELRGDRILLVATHGVQDAALLGAKTLRLDELQAPEKDPVRERRAAMSRDEIFGKMKMFQGISPRRYDDIIRKLGGFHREYGTGDIIWRQYDNYASMGIILRGAIQATDISRDEPQIIQRFEAGSAFGEGVAFGNQNSWVEIRAEEPTKILFLQAVNFTGNERDPEIVHIMVNMLQEMSGKLNLLNLKNQLISEPRLRNRLMMYFNTLTADADGWRTVPFMQKDLAQYLNANRSALNRELGRMKDERLIETDGRKVRLLCSWEQY